MSCTDFKLLELGPQRSSKEMLSSLAGCGPSGTFHLTVNVEQARTSTSFLMFSGQAKPAVGLRQKALKAEVHVPRARTAVAAMMKDMLGEVLLERVT